MRRIVTGLGSVVCALLVSAVPAAAQTGGYQPPVEVSPEIVTQGGGQGAAQGGGGAGGLAFTGAEIGLLVLAAAVLVAIGALAILAARRRAAPAA